MSTECGTADVNVIETPLYAIIVDVTPLCVEGVRCDAVHYNTPYIRWNVVVFHQFVSKLIEEHSVYCGNDAGMLVTVVAATIKSECLYIFPSKFVDEAKLITSYLLGKVIIVISTYYAGQYLFHALETKPI